MTALYAGNPLSFLLSLLSTQYLRLLFFLWAIGQQFSYDPISGHFGTTPHAPLARFETFYNSTKSLLLFRYEYLFEHPQALPLDLPARDSIESTKKLLQPDIMSARDDLDSLAMHFGEFAIENAHLNQQILPELGHSWRYKHSNIICRYLNATITSSVSTYEQIKVLENATQRLYLNSGHQRATVFRKAHKRKLWPLEDLFNGITVWDVAKPSHKEYILNYLWELDEAEKRFEDVSIMVRGYEKAFSSGLGLVWALREHYGCGTIRVSIPKEYMRHRKLDSWEYSPAATVMIVKDRLLALRIWIN